VSSQFRSQQYVVQNTQGQALAGASIAVLTQPASTGTQPGSPLATIFNAATSNAATSTGTGLDVLIGAQVNLATLDTTA
jgi:hypothetical protein